MALALALNCMCACSLLGGWVEGVAIIAAVLIVAVVTATNDFSKEQQFRALSAVNDDVFVKVCARAMCIRPWTSFRGRKLMCGDQVFHVAS